MQKTYFLWYLISASFDINVKLFITKFCLKKNQKMQATFDKYSHFPLRQFAHFTLVEFTAT